MALTRPGCQCGDAVPHYQGAISSWLVTRGTDCRRKLSSHFVENSNWKCGNHTEDDCICLLRSSRPLLFIGQMLGGETGLVVAIGAAVAMNFRSFWFSDEIVLRDVRSDDPSARRGDHRSSGDFPVTGVHSQRYRCADRGGVTNRIL